MLYGVNSDGKALGDIYVETLRRLAGDSCVPAPAKAGVRNAVSKADFTGKVNRVAIEDGEEVLKEFDYAELLLATSVSMNNLVVKSIYTTENEASSDKGAMTLTCQVGDKTVDVRTAVLKDADGNIITAEYFEGKTIDVRGVVDRFDGRYQIKVFNLNDITVK
jgi:hypothetical protein